MDAEKEHDGFAVYLESFDAREGLESVPRETFGEERQEVHDGRASRELVIRRRKEPFDGFGAEA